MYYLQMTEQIKWDQFKMQDTGQPIKLHKAEMKSLHMTVGSNVMSPHLNSQPEIM
jgi:hypothetical protein